MEIPVYRRRTETFKRPVSTAEQEGHLFKAGEFQQEAREHQRTAQTAALVGGLAQDALGVVGNILAVKSATDLMAAETEMIRRKNEFKLKLNDPNNPVPVEEWNSLLDAELASIRADEEEKLKLRRSKEEFGRRFDRWEDDFRNDIAVDAQVRTELKSESDYNNSFNNAILTGDFKKAKEYTEGVRGWLLSPAQADANIALASKTIAENYLAGLAKNIIETQGHQAAKDFIYSDQANRLLEMKGISPLVLPDRERDAIASRVATDWKNKLALVEHEHQVRRTEQRFTAYDEIIAGTFSLEELANETRLGGKYSDIEPGDQKQLMNMVKEKPAESRWEITDPGIEAQVAQYFRSDATVRQKKAYIDKRHGSGISNDDYNKYLNQIGFPSKAVGADSNTVSDPDLYAEYVIKILDANIDEFDIENELAGDIGADEDGNPRISPKDAKTLATWNRTVKTTPAYDEALGMFSQAYKDIIIDIDQMVDMQKKFEIKAESGDYTPTGLIQEATNMIAEKNEEFIEDELEKFRVEGKLFKHKETAEEWIKRHPPEKKDRSPLPPLEEGNISDFVQWRNVESTGGNVQAVNLDEGELFSDDDGKTWYMKYGGIWYIVDPPTGNMTPYKRK